MIHVNIFRILKSIWRVSTISFKFDVLITKFFISEYLILLTNYFQCQSFAKNYMMRIHFHLLKHQVKHLIFPTFYQSMCGVWQIELYVHKKVELTYTDFSNFISVKSAICFKTHLLFVCKAFLSFLLSQYTFISIIEFLFSSL